MSEISDFISESISKISDNLLENGIEHEDPNGMLQIRVTLEVMDFLVRAHHGKVAAKPMAGHPDASTQSHLDVSRKMRELFSEIHSRLSKDQTQMDEFDHAREVHKMTEFLEKLEMTHAAYIKS